MRDEIWSAAAGGDESLRYLCIGCLEARSDRRLEPADFAWPTKAELRTEVFDYIETFYNRERRHSTLGQLSPARYEMINLSHSEEDQAA